MGKRDGLKFQKKSQIPRKMSKIKFQNQIIPVFHSFSLGSWGLQRSGLVSFFGQYWLEIHNFIYLTKFSKYEHYRHCSRHHFNHRIFSWF
jgi:hypothetical protein